LKERREREEDQEALDEQGKGENPWVKSTHPRRKGTKKKGPFRVQEKIVRRKGPESSSAQRRPGRRKGRRGKKKRGAKTLNEGWEKSMGTEPQSGRLNFLKEKKKSWRL